MLKIYESVQPTTAFSNDGSMNNPFRKSFDGRTGGVIEQRLYLRNDDASFTYSGINILPVDTDSKINIIDGTDGFSWKMKAGDTQPLLEEWNTISGGNIIDLDPILDTTTYLPFWVRIEVPRGAEIESFEDVVFRISGLESNA